MPRDPGLQLTAEDRLHLCRMIERRLRQGLGTDTIAERLGADETMVERIARGIRNRGETYMKVRVDIEAIEKLKTRVKAGIRGGLQSWQAEDLKAELVRDLDRLVKADDEEEKEEDKGKKK